jgi:Ca2+-binding EF-hand superfamily protein
VQFLEEGPRLGQDPLLLYRRLFDAIDTDHSGYLTARELREFAEVIGVDLSQHDARRQLRAMDEDGDGRVDFGELVRALRLH